MEKPSAAALQAIAKFKPPPNWSQTIDNIRRVRQKYSAPVDSMGCSQPLEHPDSSVNQRFQVLQSLMLSSQTKDPITWAATQKLKSNGLGCLDGILQADEKDIEDLIYPVGFYKRKAIYLKKTAKIIKDEYNGDIPNSVKDLCKLPGVGPKMAHLCMQSAWNVNSGIGVDTHVHRISARLNWVPKEHIKTPEDTRVALESWLPKEHWREINHLLVGFGQTICLPVGPKCNECYNNYMCPSANLSLGDKKPKVSKRLAPSKQENPYILMKQEEDNSATVKVVKVDTSSKLEPPVEVKKELMTQEETKIDYPLRSKKTTTKRVRLK